MKKKMVGAVRFELTTSCTRNKRATRLRYAPNQGQQKVPRVHMNCNLEFYHRGFKQKETKETKGKEAETDSGGKAGSI